MTKACINLQDLRRRIYIKAKSEPTWRFWGLYVHICKMETLQEAYKLAKENNGAPGIDGVSFQDIEQSGVEAFLTQICEELLSETYRPLPNRRKEIPKDGGKVRILGIPSIRDRVVQGALKLILEPIFEADFQEGSYGYRPKRTQHQAVARVTDAILQNKTKIIDLDLTAYFDNVRHDILLQKVAKRINDDKVMRLLKLILKAAGKKGVPQGGVISPLLSNLYLNDVDRMLEKAKETTRNGPYNNLEYSRFADDLVVLVDAFREHNWLYQGVIRRLMEEFAKIGVQVNTQKSRLEDLATGGKFSFLGFEIQRVCDRRRRGWWPLLTPKIKKRTELLSKLKDIFRRHQSQPLSDVITLINPILRGWLNYFRIGNSSRCFKYIQCWVEKKVRRHLMRARNRKGFGWKRWSSDELYKYYGLYNDYGIRYFKPVPKALPVR